MTYEYICKCCGHTWEMEQKITDAPPSTCPKCEEECAQRQISSGNFQLQGPGWAKDGYK